MRVHPYLQERVHTPTHTQDSPLPLGEAGSLGSGRHALCVSGPLTVCGAVGRGKPTHASQHKALLPTPAQDTLTEISEWLENHPREAVVLACRNFEGMTEGLHDYLVGCIKNIFGDKLCPRGVSRGRGLPMGYWERQAAL